MRSPSARSILMLVICSSAWFGSGCSSGGGKPLDGGPRDVVTFDFRFGDLPPGCPPAGGNNIGVGAPCTKKGGECTNNLYCTCDLSDLGVQLPEGTPCFCTDLKFATPNDTRRPCEQRPAGSCGDDALCCDYHQVGSLCIPNICLDMAMCPVIEQWEPSEGSHALPRRTALGEAQLRSRLAQWEPSEGSHALPRRTALGEAQLRSRDRASPR